MGVLQNGVPAAGSVPMPVFDAGAQASLAQWMSSPGSVAAPVLVVAPDRICQTDFRGQQPFKDMRTALEQRLQQRQHCVGAEEIGATPQRDMSWIRERCAQKLQQQLQDPLLRAEKAPKVAVNGACSPPLVSGVSGCTNFVNSSSVSAPAGAPAFAWRNGGSCRAPCGGANQMQVVVPIETVQCPVACYEGLPPQTSAAAPSGTTNTLVGENPLRPRMSSSPQVPGRSLTPPSIGFPQRARCRLSASPSSASHQVTRGRTPPKTPSALSPEVPPLRLVASPASARGHTKSMTQLQRPTSSDSHPVVVATLSRSASQNTVKQVDARCRASPRPVMRMQTAPEAHGSRSARTTQDAIAPQRSVRACVSARSSNDRSVQPCTPASRGASPSSG